MSRYACAQCDQSLCACPYQRRDALPGFESFASAELVEGLLRERGELRRAKEWAPADAILRRVEALGVSVDDKRRSWSAGPVPQQKPAPDPQPSAPSSGGVACEMCGRRFASRNQVFKHLRSSGGECGASVIEQGGLAPSPGELAKQSRVAQRRVRTPTPPLPFPRRS